MSKSLNQSGAAQSQGGGAVADVEWGGADDAEDAAAAAPAAKLTKAQKKAAAKKAAAAAAAASAVVAEPQEEAKGEAEPQAEPAAAAPSAAASEVLPEVQSSTPPLETPNAVVPLSAGEAASLDATAAASEPLSPYAAGEPLRDIIDGSAIEARRDKDNSNNNKNVADSALGDDSPDAPSAAATSSSADSLAAPAASSAPSSSSSSSATAASAGAVPLPSTIPYGQPISKSPEFVNFRAGVQKQRIAVGKAVWTYFDCGPKDVEPLICLPGTGGTAEQFFHQLMSLGNRGYRVIAASPPAYWTHDEWCNGFNAFLVAMGLVHSRDPSVSASAASAAAVQQGPRVHVLANSLAGFLCLYYLSHIQPAKNFIASLVLCNSFLDTSTYQAAHGSSPWCLALLRRAPDFVVKKFVLDSLPQRTVWPEAVDFTVEQLETNLPTDALASRLTLNIARSRAVAAPHLWRDRAGQVFPQERVTILDTTDESVVPESARERLYASLPQARYALLKEGGDLPFLSVPDEVNMLLTVHLRACGIFPGIKDLEKTRGAAASAAVPMPELSAGARKLSATAASSTVVGSSSSRPGTFLAPSSRLTATGYGHEDDEEANDSIFLSKNTVSASPPVAGGAGIAGTTAGSSPPTAAGADGATRAGRTESTSGGGGSVSLGTASESRAEAERVTLLRTIQAEEAERAARLAALAAERAAREAQVAEAVRARIAQEQSQAERHSNMLSTLLDGEAAEAEKQLTADRRKQLAQPSEDLF